ncbi:MAG: hypothetical protein QXT94_03790 [Methanothrix sp.]
MAMMNMVQAINNALDLAMAEDKRVVLLGEDIGKDGGVFRVTDGLVDKYTKDRVIDTPLAESSIIGTSIGMAIAGLKPVPEIQFAGFMYLGYSQIVNHAARYRSRTRSNVSLPMVIRTPVSGASRHWNTIPRARKQNIRMWVAWWWSSHRRLTTQRAFLQAQYTARTLYCSWNLQSSTGCSSRRCPRKCSRFR